MASLSDGRRLEIAAEYCRATRENDATAMLAMSGAEAVVWHNFDEVEASMEQTVKGLRWIHRAVADLTWTDISLRPMDNGFVWQAVLTGTAPGGPLRAHSCVVVTLNDGGLITRLEEYLDRAQTAVLRG